MFATTFLRKRYIGTWCIYVRVFGLAFLLAHPIGAWTQFWNDVLLPLIHLVLVVLSISYVTLAGPRSQTRRLRPHRMQNRNHEPPTTSTTTEISTTRTLFDIAWNSHTHRTIRVLCQTPLLSSIGIGSHLPIIRNKGRKCKRRGITR